MTIEKSDFDAIAEADLQELVTARVPEGLRIEYKAAPYGRSDSDRKEFAKDVSAFANASGGHLLIGVEEEEGAASQITGIADLDVDAELQRLEQIAAHGIEPRIPGLRMQAVRLATGASVIVLRVPRSWNPPHRVVVQGSNRFYVRNSSGAHEPSVQELRTLFTLSTSSLEAARQFRDERLAQIQSGVGEPLLSGDGRLVLHIVPIPSLSGGVKLDMRQVDAQREALRPLAQKFVSSARYNYHGFINERAVKGNGYTQVFRDGMLEATMGNIVSKWGNRRTVRALVLEQCFFNELPRYVDALQKLGISPPLIVMLTLEGVQGAHYIVTNGPPDFEYEWPDALPAQLALLPECIIEDYGEVVAYHRAVKPAFDALWNSAGYPHAQTFDKNGQWTGQNTVG